MVERTRVVKTNRWAETIAFLLGVLNLSAHGFVESARHWGWTHGDCGEHAGFPYAVLFISALLVAPKMIGRSRAGAAWSAMSLRLAGRGPAQATVTMKDPDGEQESKTVQIERPPEAPRA